MIVKKWPAKKRVTIQHSGPEFQPYGFLNPPFYPSPLTYNGAPYNSKLMEPPSSPPMRKMIENIIWDKKNVNDSNLEKVM